METHDASTMRSNAYAEMMGAFWPAGEVAVIADL